jgi:hypothetical protein
MATLFATPLRRYAAPLSLLCIQLRSWQAPTPAICPPAHNPLVLQLPVSPTPRMARAVFQPDTDRISRTLGLGIALWMLGLSSANINPNRPVNHEHLLQFSN